MHDRHQFVVTLQALDDPKHPLGKRRLGQRGQFRDRIAHDPFQHPDQQGIFVVEVPVDRGRCYPGGRRKLPHRCVVVPDVCE